MKTWLIWQKKVAHTHTFTTILRCMKGGKTERGLWYTIACDAATKSYVIGFNANSFPHSFSFLFFWIVIGSDHFADIVVYVLRIANVEKAFFMPLYSLVHAMGKLYLLLLIVLYCTHISLTRSDGERESLIFEFDWNKCSLDKFEWHFY